LEDSVTCKTKDTHKHATDEETLKGTDNDRCNPALG
jgi:hypothetical protein